MKAIIFAVCVATALAVAVRKPRQAVITYTLPDGNELILGGAPKTTFSCDGKIYGYYADVDNDCKIFHVCVPGETTEEGLVVEQRMFSFICGNQTVFDQENLVCNWEDDEKPCSGAPSFYNVNENFGKIIS